MAIVFVVTIVPIFPVCSLELLKVDLDFFGFLASSVEAQYPKE
jgi:hypothetical protein